MGSAGSQGLGRGLARHASWPSLAPAGRLHTTRTQDVSAAFPAEQGAVSDVRRGGTATRRAGPSVTAM